jgi:hypothetical protein
MEVAVNQHENIHFTMKRGIRIMNFPLSIGQSHQQLHTPTEDKIDDAKDSFHEELKCVFDKFPKYHVKILLGYFSIKVGREDIFKPTIGNESLQEIIMMMELD